MDAEPTTPRAGVAREGDTGPDVNPWGPNLVREFHPRAAATAQGHLRLILYLVLIFFSFIILDIFIFYFHPQTDTLLFFTLRALITLLAVTIMVNCSLCVLLFFIVSSP